MPDGCDLILTPAALGFIAKLHRSFDRRRRALLDQRVRVQQQLDSGWLPSFLPETAQIRQGDWVVAPTPPDLLDRRVEITGPVDRKMVINALNSGASVFMADFEDSNSPTWDNMIDGQINLRDAVARHDRVSPAPRASEYALNRQTATLMVRPRGWHLPEKHVLVDGKPVSASLFDFGLYFFHNAAATARAGHAARTSTCPSWKATSKRGCGTTCS